MIYRTRTYVHHCTRTFPNCVPEKKRTRNEEFASPLLLMRRRRRRRGNTPLTSKPLLSIYRFAYTAPGIDGADGGPLVVHTQCRPATTKPLSFGLLGSITLLRRAAQQMRADENQIRSSERGRGMEIPQHIIKLLFNTNKTEHKQKFGQ